LHAVWQRSKSRTTSRRVRLKEGKIGKTPAKSWVEAPKRKKGGTVQEGEMRRFSGLWEKGGSKERRAGGRGTQNAGSGKP